MQKILLIIYFAITTISVYAQNLVKVTHLQNVAYLGTNSVTVKGIGKPGNTYFDGVEPYYIGNKSRLNGYSFYFQKPVRKIQLHFTAMNPGEKIQIDINGVKYNLSPANISSNGTKLDPSTIIEDGLFSIKMDKMPNVTVSIFPGYDVNTVYVHHLNGLSAGCVFDLYFEDDGIKTGNVTGNSSSTDFDEASASGNTAAVGSVTVTKGFQLYPNPNSGSFVISGKINADKELQLKIADETGRTVYEKKVSSLNRSINEKIDLDNATPNGVYTVFISDDTHIIQNIKFTVTR